VVGSTEKPARMRKTRRLIELRNLLLVPM